MITLTLAGGEAVAGPAGVQMAFSGEVVASTVSAKA